MIDEIGALRSLLAAGIAKIGTVVDGAPAAADFDTSIVEATDWHFNGDLLLFLDGPNIGQSHLIDVYTAVNGNVSFAASDQWTDVPANGNSFIIIPKAGAYLKKIFTDMAKATTALSTADWTAARAGYLDELAAANLPADIDGLTTSTGRQLFTMDFWSIPQIAVVVPAVAADQALPDVVVAALPAGMTVVRAVAIFIYRCIQNAGAANMLAGAQFIQIQKGGAGGYANAITLVDDQFPVAAAAVDAPGGTAMGDLNVVAKVSADDTYNFQWDEAVADVAGLTFTDIQMGIRIWYSV